jgi:hypothetical protein
VAGPAFLSPFQEIDMTTKAEKEAAERKALEAKQQAAAKESAKPGEVVDGAGRAYTEQETGSLNPHGKMSATAAGGDPVNSPVIGNPGENRPDMSYDYGLAAAAPAAGAARPVADPSVSQRMQSVEVLGQVLGAAASEASRVAPRPGDANDETEYAEVVRARSKGHYDGVREVGDVFSNPRNLPTYPEDPKSWFEDADRPLDWEEKERAGRRRAR